MKGCGAQAGMVAPMERANADQDHRAKESMLDALPGVGPARKRALLRHFGSTEQLLKASRDELEGVPGVPARVGRQIHSALRRTG